MKSEAGGGVGKAAVEGHDGPTSNSKGQFKMEGVAGAKRRAGSGDEASFASTMNRRI